MIHGDRRHHVSHGRGHSSVPKNNRGVGSNRDDLRDGLRVHHGRMVHATRRDVVRPNHRDVVRPTHRDVVRPTHRDGAHASLRGVAHAIPHDVARAIPHDVAHAIPHDVAHAILRDVLRDIRVLGDNHQLDGYMGPLNGRLDHNVLRPRYNLLFEDLPFSQVSYPPLEVQPSLVLLSLALA